MKLSWFAIGLLLLSATGSAQAPDAPVLSDYAWAFPIETPDVASFYTVELPLELYQSVTDAELRDAGVYNGAGQAVPRLFFLPDDNVETAETQTPLPMLPLYTAGERTDGQLVIRRAGDGTGFSFDLDDLDAPGEGERLAAYIVDARQVDDRAAALDLSWDGAGPGFMGRVTVDGGDDLQTWTAAGSAVVADLRENDASIVQRRVRLHRADYDYLRIRWEGLPEAWRLSGVSGVFEAGGSQPVRTITRLDPSGVDSDDGGRLFDLGGAPRVDQVQIRLPQPNTVIAAIVYYWSVPRQRWVQAGRGSFHHIVRDDQSVVSEPLAIGMTRANRFKVIVNRGPADVALQLEIGWRPDSLLFVAQGPPPFTLATGNAYEATLDFPQERIFGDRTLQQLARDNGGASAAGLGARYELGGADRLAVVEPIDWRRIALWFGLLLGVAFVGFMAVRTVRELKSAGS